MTQRSRRLAQNEFYHLPARERGRWAPVASDYFALMIEDQRLLEKHGFDHWPGDEELVRYLFDVEEKIDLLAQVMGLEMERDVRGRLHAYRRQEVV